MKIRKNLYGAAASASLDPRLFMIQACKKIVLNNENIIKFLKDESPDDTKTRNIHARLLNSVRIIEEMDMLLNREVENAAVTNTEMTLQWVLREMESFRNDWKIRDIEDIEHHFKDINYIMNNIKEGFESIG